MNHRKIIVFCGPSGSGKTSIVKDLLNYFSELAFSISATTRDKRKNEVDIVLEQADGRLIGIEVKASNTIRKNDFKGLKKLAELTMNQFKFGIVFYTGSRLMPFGDDSNLYFAVPLSIIIRV